MAKSGGGGAGNSIVNCACKHPYQDAKYGDGKRVATNGGGTKKTCTVCGRVHN